MRPDRIEFFDPATGGVYHLFMPSGGRIRVCDPRTLRYQCLDPYEVRKEIKRNATGQVQFCGVGTARGVNWTNTATTLATGSVAVKTLTLTGVADYVRAYICAIAGTLAKATVIILDDTVTITSQSVVNTRAIINLTGTKHHFSKPRAKYRYKALLGSIAAGSCTIKLQLNDFTTETVLW